MNNQLPAGRRVLTALVFGLGLSTMLLAACGSNRPERPPAGVLVTAAAANAAVDAPSNAESATTPNQSGPASAASAADSTVSAPDREPTQSAETVLTTVEELVADYGEPPAATFARLRIPLLGVDAPVGASMVQGQMVAPNNPVEVFWYDMSSYPGMGGIPGAGGNAIFSAHVDFAAQVPYAGVRYRGLGVFGHLKLLSPGDVIEVDYDGQALRYQVTWSKQVDAVTGDWAAIWSDDVAGDSITLYTCAGNFDRASFSYDERVVIRAERL